MNGWNAKPVALNLGAPMTKEEREAAKPVLEYPFTDAPYGQREAADALQNLTAEGYLIVDIPIAPWPFIDATAGILTASE